MKKIIYSLVIMIAAGSLFTSCIENVEPEGIEILREAKADYLAALSELRAADAKVQEAQAAFIQAQAAVQTAIAAQEKAKAELEALKVASQAAKNEQDKAQIEAAIIKIKEDSAIQSVKNQNLLATAQAALAAAIRGIEAKAMLLTKEEYTVIVTATTAYEVALVAYDAAYDAWAAQAAKLYSDTYDNGCWDFEAIYKDSVNYYKAKMQYWASYANALVDNQNEPAQWKDSLDKYEYQIDSLKYEKNMLGEEEAIDNVAAGDAFKEFRMEVHEKFYTGLSKYEKPTFTSEVKEIPSLKVNRSLVPQFGYLLYPVLKSNNSLDRDGFSGMYYDAVNGAMGFNDADYDEAYNILYGGAIDDDMFGPWLQRNSDFIDNGEFIGLVDLVETLGRDKVLATTEYAKDSADAKKAWDAADSTYKADLATLNAGAKKFQEVIDAEAAVETKNTEMASAKSAFNAAVEAESNAEAAVDSTTGAQLAKIYSAVDDLVSAIKGITFGPDSTITMIPEEYLKKGYGHYLSGKFEDRGQAYKIASYSYNRPLDFDGTPWKGELDGVKWFRVKAFDYSMSSADSLALFNAIKAYAKAKADVLKDTAKLVYVSGFKIDGEPVVEVKPIYELEFSGFKQTICNTLFMHGDTQNLPGTYAYSLYGGQPSYELYNNANHFWQSIVNLFTNHSYRNEYPCYWVLTKDGYKALPANPQDDAFARCLTELRISHKINWDAARDIVSYALGYYDVKPTYKNDPEDYEQYGPFAWDKNFTDAFYFSELSWIVREISEQSSTLHLVDKDGNFQLKEVLKNSPYYSSKPDSVKTFYEYYVKAIINTFMTLDYVETLSTKDKDIDALIKQVNDTLANTNRYKTAKAKRDQIDTILQHVINREIDIYGDWYVQYGGKTYDIRTLYWQYKFWDSRMIANQIILNEKTHHISCEVQEVKDAVASYVEARNDYKAKFNAYNTAVGAYNTAIDNQAKAYAAYNTVYKNFWGLSAGPYNEKVVKSTVKKDDSNPCFLSNKIYYKAEDKVYGPWHVQGTSTYKPGKPTETKVNWTLATFSDPDDIIIPTWKGDQLQNYNEKLAVVLASLEENANSTSGKKYLDFYADPEASYIIKGDKDYTELSKIFFAKYDYLKKANYVENADAYKAIKAAVAELVNEYEESVAAAQEYYKGVVAVLESIFGKFDEEVPAVAALAKYDELIKETGYIALGQYPSNSKKDDEAEEESEDKPKTEWKTYDYKHFRDVHVVVKHPYVDKSIEGLGTGSLAALAKEYLGEFLDREFAREVATMEINHMIADLEYLFKELNDVYCAALEMGTGYEDENDMYGEKFDAMLKKIALKYEAAEGEVWKWEKALEQLAAGYDPYQIESNVAVLNLQVLEQKLEIAKTALEGAKAQYEKIMAKYAAK